MTDEKDKSKNEVKLTRRKQDAAHIGMIIDEVTVELKGDLPFESLIAMANAQLDRMEAENAKEKGNEKAARH